VARFALDHIRVESAAVRRNLRNAAQTSGEEYEGALGGWIAKREIPILERIEERTGIPVTRTSLDKTRGPKSSQSMAIFQWHRGHRQANMLRIPEGTVEIVGIKGAITQAFIMEVSLQTDITPIGGSFGCQLKMEKTDQLVWSTSILAGKYREAPVDYMYLCPREPSSDTIKRLLDPLRNLKSTDNVSFTWMVIDHTEVG
jgi:hypothetical protein